jgi:hypothetical protein
VYDFYSNRVRYGINVVIVTGDEKSFLERFCILGSPSSKKSFIVSIPESYVLDLLTSNFGLSLTASSCSRDSDNLAARKKLAKAWSIDKSLNWYTLM